MRNSTLEIEARTERERDDGRAVSENSTLT
jgi:hypothetical protein